ncbi:Carcinine [Hypsibius exemplaris]|uniref:Carcinine n=1 Tax=Hypsibius exemplaris TaxID=2072580 RepID=A0A1W0WTH5_HYPEX|nr:Carcinine [Hypsibius exemplaris]
MALDFDDVLKDVGEFGRFQQLLLIFVLLPPCLPGAFHGFSQIFVVATPSEFWCRNPKAGAENLSQSDIQGLLPRRDDTDNTTYSQCLMYDFSQNSSDYHNRNWTSDGTVPCQYGWEFDRSVYQSTIVTDWNLVCDKSFLPTLSLFIHTLGTLLGTLISGYLTDEIGRKKTFCVAVILQLLTGATTVAAPDFITFCVIRFLNGLTIVPVWLIPLIMALEITGPSKRAPVGTTTALCYTFGVILLAGIAYGVRNWVHLQLAVTLPFTFLIGSIWWMPESPRWLMSRGKWDEMLVIVKKMARINRVDLPADYFEELLVKCKAARKADSEGRKRYRVVDIFRTPNLRKKSCLIIFNSFCNYAVYSGLNFFAPQLGGDDHLNFLLSSLIELPAYTILYFCLNRFGRRPLLTFSMIFGGSFLIAAALVPEKNHLTVLFLFLISKFCMTCSFFVTDLVASETFPTVVRGAGASLTQTVSTIGLCLSPLIAHLGSHVIYLPLVIFGILGIVGGAVTLLLPETVDQYLPETMDEGEAFGKHMTWRDCFHLGKPKVTVKE